MPSSTGTSRWSGARLASGCRMSGQHAELARLGSTIPACGHRAPICLAGTRHPQPCPCGAEPPLAQLSPGSGSWVNWGSQPPWWGERPPGLRRTRLWRWQDLAPCNSWQCRVMPCMGQARAGWDWPPAGPAAPIPLWGDAGTCSRQVPAHRPVPAVPWRHGEPCGLATFPRSHPTCRPAACVGRRALTPPGSGRRALRSVPGRKQTGPRGPCRGCRAPLGNASTCRRAAPVQGGRRHPCRAAPSRATLRTEPPPRQELTNCCTELGPAMERSRRHQARKQLRHHGTGSSARALPGAEDGVVMVCEDIPECPAAPGISGSFYSIQHSLRLREL